MNIDTRMWIASFLYILLRLFIGLIKSIKNLIINNGWLIISVIFMILFLNCVDNEKLVLFITEHLDIILYKISFLGISIGLSEIIILILCVWILLQSYIIILVLYQEVRKYICNIFLIALWIYYKIFAKTTNEFMEMESENMKQRIVLVLLITGIVTMLLIYKVIISPMYDSSYLINYVNETVIQK